MANLGAEQAKQLLCRPRWLSRLTTLVIFVCMCKTVCSYNRGWRYHMSLRVWLARSDQDDLKERTTSHETGFYNVFDPVEWRKVRKELKLEYNQLEGRPRLPESLIQPSGNQCAQADASNISPGSS
uniref:NOT2_3_5 domain-containing protein n=1 Tax=Ascaris lumbricoides TaxID=6252 RepID=A0A0M3HQA5_ASCLU